MTATGVRYGRTMHSSIGDRLAVEYEIFGEAPLHPLGTIGAREFSPKNGNLHFFEVKTTVGSTPPRLSVAQQNSTTFIDSRLGRAAGGTGAWQPTAVHDPNTATAATALRNEIASSPNPPQTSVIRVTLEEGTPNASDISIDPWP